MGDGNLQDAAKEKERNAAATQLQALEQKRSDRKKASKKHAAATQLQVIAHGTRDRLEVFSFFLATVTTITSFSKVEPKKRPRRTRFFSPSLSEASRGQVGAKQKGERNARVVSRYTTAELVARRRLRTVFLSLFKRSDLDQISPPRKIP